MLMWKYLCSKISLPNPFDHFRLFESSSPFHDTQPNVFDTSEL